MQEKKELISAWVDGECTPDEVQRCLQAIQKSPQLLRYWQCCHSMRDIAQNCYGYTPCESLLENINANLSVEAVTQAASNVVPIKTNKKKPKHWIPMALAATIAFMAVLFITRQPASLSINTPQLAINQATSSTVIPPEKVALTEQTEEPLATLDNRIAVDSEGNMYLADHLIDKKQLSIQHRGSNPYIERVDY